MNTQADELQGCYGFGACEEHATCVRYWVYQGKDSSLTPIPFCGQPGNRPQYIPIVPVKAESA